MRIWGEVIITGKITHAKSFRNDDRWPISPICCPHVWWCIHICWRATSLHSPVCARVCVCIIILLSAVQHRFLTRTMINSSLSIKVFFSVSLPFRSFLRPCLFRVGRQLIEWILRRWFGHIDDVTQTDTRTHSHIGLFSVLNYVRMMLICFVLICLHQTAFTLLLCSLCYFEYKSNLSKLEVSHSDRWQAMKTHGLDTGHTFLPIL